MFNFFEELLGKTFDNVYRMDHEIYFKGEKSYKLYHLQSCCEIVELEDVCGDLSDLIGEEIIMAEEVTDEKATDWGSQTWTFQKIGTSKGTVTFRWLGTSNGCYSETISITEIKE